MIKINLAPTRKRPGSGLRLTLPAFNLLLVFGVFYVLAAAGVGFTWWTLEAEKGRLVRAIDQANRELATLKTVVAQSGQVKAQLAELKQRVQTLQGLTKAQGQPIVMLDAFADAVPADVWITGIEEKATSLKVTGAAFSTTALSDLMTNLRRSGRFKEVDIVMARQDLAKTPRLVTFEVTCRFEG
jgi:Tfp pilus assembly protein PilN